MFCEGVSARARCSLEIRTEIASDSNVRAQIERSRQERSVLESRNPRELDDRQMPASVVKTKFQGQLRARTAADERPRLRTRRTPRPPGA